VKLVVDLRLRPSPAVEVAAYYLVSEALANAVKHAAAHEVAVHVHTVREEGATAVSVKVTDDGVGGAAPQGGSGLQGLRDRVAVLDGRLDISSPPGEGTTVKAVIPCE
jgi:signal transduction histidine kinase